MTESERRSLPDQDEGRDDSAQAGGATPGRRRDSRRRRLARGTLLVVGCLLAIFSVLIIWVRAELLNTDAYVATMAPLASSPAVQNAIATDISNQLAAKVDVQAKVKDALPPSAASLAAPLASQLQSFTYNAAKRVVSSDRFQSRWVSINRNAHSAIVAVLTGEQKGRVSTAGGKVTLDLSSVTSQLQSRLESSGVTAFQNVNLGNGQIVLLDSPTLQTVQGATKVLKGLAYLFPVLALGCLAGVVALTKDHRRGVLRAAVWLAGAMVALLALIAVLRQIYLGEVVSPRLPSDAANDIFNALFAFVRLGAIIVFAVGVVVALAAALAGPSRPAVATRRTVRDGLGRARRQDLGPAGRWVGRNRGALRIGILVGAFLVLVSWNQATGWVVLGLALIVAVLFGIVELFGRPSLPRDSAGTEAQPTPADPAAPSPTAATGMDHSAEATPATHGPSE
jgi:hypothetical protein